VLCPVTRGNAAHAAARSPDPECAAQVIQACGFSFSRNHADHVRKNQEKKRVFSLDARDREGRTPLEVAFSRQKSARRSAPTCSPPDVAAASSTLENEPERVSLTKKTNTKTSGAYRVARALLDAGASPSARFAGGASPLAAAVAGGAAELCELLLERGADPDDGGALFDSPSPSRAEEGVETDDDEGSATFDPRRRAEHESEKQNATCALASPALVAVRHSRADLLRLLVDQGADADAPAPCASGAFAPAADAAVAGRAASHKRSGRRRRLGIPKRTRGRHKSILPRGPLRLRDAASAGVLAGRARVRLDAARRGREDGGAGGDAPAGVRRRGGERRGGRADA
jgi:hypothetical protein